MVGIIPRFDVQLFNDAAISPGTPVKDILTMQYDGVLVGALFKGAGAEGIRLTFSDGEEDQHIPAVDVAIDADNLGMFLGPSPGKEFNGFTTMNQPMAKGTKIGMVQEGTGTAEGNVWCLFSQTPTGPFVLNVAVLVDFSAASLNDLIMDCPTYLASFKRVFVRGAAGNDLTIQLGAGGRTVPIPVRAIAVNTDVEPWTYHTVDSDIPDKILFTSMNGFSGTGWFYAQFE